MKKTIRTWEQFQEAWDGLTNFLMAGECIPFSYSMPSIERIVDALRFDAATRIQVRRHVSGYMLEDPKVVEEFRRLPIEDAMLLPVSLAHFNLPVFYGKDQLLDGFEEQVMEPLKKALQEAGFTWTRCNPYIFISGPNRSSIYHMDFSHVLAWQIYGTKIFSGLKDPDRWATLEERMHSRGMKRPEGITPDDVLAYEMPPGTALWNCFLTAHWVEATDRIACSVNISFGGLRHKGKLCRHEEEYEQWKKDHPK